MLINWIHSVARGKSHNSKNSCDDVKDSGKRSATSQNLGDCLHTFVAQLPVNSWNVDLVHKSKDNQRQAIENRQNFDVCFLVRLLKSFAESGGCAMTQYRLKKDHQHDVEAHHH